MRHARSSINYMEFVKVHVHAALEVPCKNVTICPWPVTSREKALKRYKLFVSFLKRVTPIRVLRKLQEEDFTGTTIDLPIFTGETNPRIPRDPTRPSARRCRLGLRRRCTHNSGPLSSGSGPPCRLTSVFRLRPPYRCAGLCFPEVAP